MIRIIHFSPQEIVAHVREGTTILRAAKAARVPLSHVCGGKGACGTCKVQVSVMRGDIPKVTPVECRRLTERQLQNGFRLGCQTKVIGNYEVTIPESPLQRVVRLKLEEARKAAGERSQGDSFPKGTT